MLGVGWGGRVHCPEDRVSSQVWSIMGSGGYAVAGDIDMNLLMAVTVMKLVLEVYDGGQWW